MNALDIFLKALERVLKFSKGIFIPIVSTIENSKFPAIKQVKIEVYYNNNTDNKNISTVIKNFNSSEDSVDAVKERAVQETIENILKFYGL